MRFATRLGTTRTIFLSGCASGLGAATRKRATREGIKGDRHRLGQLTDASLLPIIVGHEFAGEIRPYSARSSATSQRASPS